MKKNVFSFLLFQIIATAAFAQNYGSVYLESPQDGLFYSEKIISTHIQIDKDFSSDQDLGITVKSGYTLNVRFTDGLGILAMQKKIKNGYSVDITPCLSRSNANIEFNRCMGLRNVAPEIIASIFDDASQPMTSTVFANFIKNRKERLAKPMNLTAIENKRDWSVLTSPNDKCLTKVKNDIIVGVWTQDCVHWEKISSIRSDTVNITSRKTFSVISTPFKFDQKEKYDVVDTSINDTVQNIQMANTICKSIDYPLAMIDQIHGQLFCKKRSLFDLN